MLIGESGVGKSTLLNLCAGLDGADEGDIILAGRSLRGLDDNGLAAIRRHSLGFVFQAFHLIPHLRLWQNVALPLLLMGGDEARQPGPRVRCLAKSASRTVPRACPANSPAGSSSGLHWLGRWCIDPP